MEIDADAVLERIVAVASRVLDATAATITYFSADRRCHGAVIGCDTSDADHIYPFCQVAMQQGDILVVPDITKDARFAGGSFSPGRRKVRFYAGAPILGPEGTPIGTLNVLGYAPRPGLTDEDHDTLRDLAVLAGEHGVGAAGPDAPQHANSRRIPAVSVTHHARQLKDIDGNALFRIMFENNPLPMVLYDPQTLGITQVNQAIVTAYGYSGRDFIKLGILDLVPEEDRDEARAFIEQRAGQRACSAWTHLRASGERIRVQVITHPLTLGSQRLRLAVIWDVTEFEYAQNALRQSNNELLALAGQLQTQTAELTNLNRRARLGMWRLPVGGGAAEWSSEIFEIFGQPVQSTGPDFATLLTWIAPGDRARVRDITGHAHEQRTAQCFEFRVVQPNGAIRHCFADLRPELSFGDHLIALKGFCQDVTERKETELALLRSEKLKTIGQFSGGVAHDFNNLLTVMMLNVEEAMDSIAPDDPLQGLLGPVLHAAMRGSDLTSRLLSYARRSPLEPMRVSLEDLIDELNPLLDLILGDRFTLEIRHGQGAVQPFVDAAKLENALLTLVINARDAMPFGGKIVISTAVATLSRPDAIGWTNFIPGHYAEISVADSGCGISAAVIPHLFEPFITTKAFGKDGGLGLRMVHAFAKQSSGHVAIASTIAVGTTATLYLPLQAAPEIAAKPGLRTASRAIAPRMSALIVEDQPEVLETVQRQLVSLGFKVIVAADAARAMDHITSSSTFDLLFSDVAIAGPIGGTGLAAIARQRHPAIRILLTSGYMAYAGARATESAADIDFLQKPYTRIELAERLAAMFPAPGVKGA